MTRNIPVGATTGPISVPTSIFSAHLRWTTIGAFALIFLGAFETLAVTTIMPTISRDLNGQALYSVAFSSTLAASVIGMVLAGQWSDRTGPAKPLIAAMVVFTLGLLAAGFAGTMGIFIAGRFLQGLGSGALIVSLYVVVARLYPAALHPKIFGLFASAWVLPSLIGPPLAGVVAEQISWHWVFFGVVFLVLAAASAILPAIRILMSQPVVPAEKSSGGRAVVWAIVAALAVMGISLGGERDGALAWPLAGGAFVIVIIALRPLLPTGSLSFRRGLPATIVLRGFFAAAFFSTEVYLPYLLNERYGLPAWAAGLILTVGAVSWAVGSALQGRLPESVSHGRVVVAGALLLSFGIATQFITAYFMLSLWVAAIGWLVAGAGMGITFPRLSTLVLSHSSARDQGFNSAALSISDAAGGAIAIAFSGLVFAAVGGLVDGAGFVAALGLATVVAIASVPVALRVRT
ncbi:MFS transporter [Salinibacterium sp. NSLL150]|uniref:MFS transporter n=1 Tax=unclassified Salinibacterium TaxID=2632331 RepID=UPI0018CF678F|nr:MULTISPECIES: MFS transporter [unclassified Salinibacterium]MBH0098721.1 MFS transporter [Salinibacterium sp. NSLL35]MBH0101476.1 MFS transporter [Salinibacterium sp. NSLL150]MBH0104235.1 MFS transporter [Salinibacterium sp. NSLL16]MBH0106996.1 MFS transporter [Salinibacterium sp. NSLL17]